MRTLSLALLLWLALASARAQQAPDVHSKATIALRPGKGLAELAALGIETDHGTLTPVAFTSFFSTAELARIRQAGFGITILEADATQAFVERNKAAKKKADSPPAAPAAFEEDCDKLRPRSIPRGWRYGSMGGYLTYEEALAHLDSMRARYPSLITARAPIESFRTTEGRPIHFVRLAGNAAVSDTTKPHVLLTAIHHAREPLSVHQLIFFLWYLLENYDRDADIRALVNNTQLYAVPFVNPDGYVYNQQTAPQGGGMWRKNRQAFAGGTGVDPNRNYGTFWGFDDRGSSPDEMAETYRGPAAFSEPETQAIRALARRYPFRIALNYHSFSDVLIHPFGYASRQTADSSSFRYLAQALTKENEYPAGTTLETIFYNANGGSDDYLYTPDAGKPERIFSYTPEIGRSFWHAQDEILPIILGQQHQNLTALRAAHPFAIFADSTGLFLRPGANANPGRQRIRYALRRVGADRRPQATFTLRLEPFGPGHASTAPVERTYTLRPEQAATDSILVPEGPIGSPVGRRLGWRVRVSNGLFSTTDTIYHYDGYPQTRPTLQDACDALAGWAGTWEIDRSRHAQGTGCLSDGPGNYVHDAGGFTQYTTWRTRPFDLRLPRLAAAELSLLTRRNLLRLFDAGQLSLSADSGAAWTATCTDGTRRASYRHNQDNVVLQAEPGPVWNAALPAWRRQWADLRPYLGQKVWMQLMLGATPGAPNDYDGIYIDDIRIRYVQTGVVTALASTSAAEGLQAVPNPATGSFTLLGLTVPTPLRLTDALGRTVLETVAQPGQPISLQGLAPGLYTWQAGHAHGRLLVE